MAENKAVLAENKDVLSKYNALKRKHSQDEEDNSGPPEKMLHIRLRELLSPPPKPNVFAYPCTVTVGSHNISMVFNWLSGAPHNLQNSIVFSDKQSPTPETNTKLYNAFTATAGSLFGATEDKYICEKFKTRIGFVVCNNITIYICSSPDFREQFKITSPVALVVLKQRA